MSENTKANDWSKRELGALWKKKSATQTYLTGHLSFEDGERINVVIFSNKNKKNDKAPDFRVYVSEPKGQSAKPVAQATSAPKKLVKTPVKAIVEEDEDIL